jgi:hypothetical protein
MAVFTAPAITTDIREIGPGEAAELLSQNTHNRKLRPRLVEQLAGAMARDEWVFNGDAVRIADSGVLLDGQHRLAAVVRSGRAQRFLVISGLSDAAQETMDTGAKRSIGDMLKLRGESDVNRLAAVVRLVWHYERRQTFRSPLVPPTQQQMIACLEQHPETREAVRQTRPVLTNTQLSGGPAGACYYLFSRVDPTDAEVFFTRFAMGTELVPGSPIHLLRRRFLEPRPQGKLSPVTQGALVIKAFNAWRRGDEQRSFLRWAAGGSIPEKFPVVEGLDWTPTEAA